MSTNEQTLICLDIGGVIVRHCRTWEEGCASAGLPVREPERLGSVRLETARRDANDAHQRGELSPEEFWAAIVHGTDDLYSIEEIERLHHAWILEE